MSIRPGTNKRASVVLNEDTMDEQQQGSAPLPGDAGNDISGAGASDTSSDGSRGYHAYTGQGDLQFCPLKDLNLPSSYSEVVSRFKRLQGDRDAEVLN